MVDEQQRPAQNLYRCGHCGHEGPAYGAPSGNGVSAPWCTQCGLNNQLTRLAGKPVESAPQPGESSSMGSGGLPEIPAVDYAQRLAHLGTLQPEGILRELLAVIHGDGGHYADEHGLAKAVADAEVKWYGRGVAPCGEVKP
jgi:hypothetical protein